MSSPARVQVGPRSSPKGIPGQEVLSPGSLLSTNCPRLTDVDVLFLDDSVQNAGRPGLGKLIAVGGILVEEDQLEPLRDWVDAIAKAYRIPEGCELKWSPPPENWIHDNLVKANRHNCYATLLDAASKCEARAIVTVFDTGKTTLQGGAALFEALTYTIDRARMQLDNLGRLGLVIADRPGGGADEESRLLQEALELIEVGSRYVAPRRIPLNVLTTPSHLVRHLQIADLVVGITTAMIGDRTRYAAPLFPLVQRILIRNRHGCIGGTGLKVFPNSLLNLYHWVLGEDAYIRAKSGSSYELPWREWAYFYSGGDPRAQDPEERAAQLRP